MFRIVVYWSKDKTNKYAAIDMRESEYYSATASEAWNIWWVLTKEANLPHVEVYDKYGRKCDPTVGYLGM